MRDLHLRNNGKRNATRFALALIVSCVTVACESKELPDPEKPEGTGGTGEAIDRCILAADEKRELERKLEPTRRRYAYEDPSAG